MFFMRKKYKNLKTGASTLAVINNHSNNDVSNSLITDSQITNVK